MNKSYINKSKKEAFMKKKINKLPKYFIAHLNSTYNKLKPPGWISVFPKPEKYEWMVEWKKKKRYKDI